MLSSFKILRPVGNTINTSKSFDNKNLFSPYNSTFYNSGTAALAASILACKKLKPAISSPEILVPAYACPDLISAIVYAKAIPVLIDLECASPNMSIECINSTISENTIAIIAIRSFGLNENFEALADITKKHEITLIEDSAQGFPSQNMSTYWHGDFIILSFGRGKPVNLMGGGAILTKDEKLCNLLPIPLATSNSIIKNIKYKLKLFLYNKSIRPFIYSLITKIPGINIGQTIYKPLEEITHINTATKYLLSSNFHSYKNKVNCQKKYQALLKKCNDTLLVDLPTKLSHDMNQPLLRYPILIRNSSTRNRIYKKLKPYGASIMYKSPLYIIENISLDIKNSNSNYPNATLFAEQLLTLPTHEGVTQNSIKCIEEILSQI